MIKYEPYEGITEEEFDKAPLSKMLLSDGKSENIWIKRVKGKIVLCNSAVAFHPFPTWGLVLDSGSLSEVITIKESEPSVLRVVKFRFDALKEEKFILEDGSVNPDYKDPNIQEHGPEEHEVCIGGFYLYEDQLLALQNATEFRTQMRGESERDVMRKDPIKFAYPLRAAIHDMDTLRERKYHSYMFYYDTRNGSLDDVCTVYVNWSRFKVEQKTN
jgi:hypothetical protein